MVTTDKVAIAEEDLQQEIRAAGIEATICELDPAAATVTVHAHSIVDWLLAKSELKQKGLTAVQPV